MLVSTFFNCLMLKPDYNIPCRLNSINIHVYTYLLFSPMHDHCIDMVLTVNIQCNIKNTLIN